MKNCDYCGIEKEEAALVSIGKIKICFLCNMQQGKKSRGKEIKAKHGMLDNSNFLA